MKARAGLLATLACLVLMAALSVVGVGGTFNLPLGIAGALLIRFVLVRASRVLASVLLGLLLAGAWMNAWMGAGDPVAGMAILGSLVYLAVHPECRPRLARQEAQELRPIVGTLARWGLYLLAVLGLGFLSAYHGLSGWDEPTMISDDPLEWAAALAVLSLMPCGLQTGWVRLVLLGPALALLDHVAGGALLAVMLLALPGLMAAALSVAVGRLGLERAWVLGSLTTLLSAAVVTPDWWQGDAPRWLAAQILAQTLIAAVICHLSWRLEGHQAQAREARELGLERPVMGAGQEAAEVVLGVVRWASPLDWMLVLTAPFWRWLDGPGPEFEI